MRNRLIAVFSALVVGVGISITMAAPASAHTALLGYCPSYSEFRLHLPAVRSLGNSSNWADDGFRSCEVAAGDSHVGARGTIWVKCWGGNGHHPIFNIVNDYTGFRTQHTVPCDNAWRSWTSSVSGWPGGTNYDAYHCHFWQTDIDGWWDAQFTGAEIRWGIAP